MNPCEVRLNSFISRWGATNRRPTPSEGAAFEPDHTAVGQTRSCWEIRGG